MLFLGDDWAEGHHDVELVDEDGNRLAVRRFAEGLAGVTALHGLIADHLPEPGPDLNPGAPNVVVGIESDRGPWVGGRDHDRRVALAGMNLPWTLGSMTKV